MGVGGGELLVDPAAGGVTMRRSPSRFARRLDQQGYVRFRHWRIYGERGLASEHGAVWLYGENLAVHFAEEPLAQFKVSYERDQKGLKTITDARLFETQFRSPQLLLWELGPEDWHLVLRLPEYVPRRAVAEAAQLPLLLEEAALTG
jgi:hypothetical protein